jgi:hypothetical protein
MAVARRATSRRAVDRAGKTMKRSLLVSSLVLFTFSGCSVASKFGLGKSSGSGSTSPAGSSSSAPDRDVPSAGGKPEMSDADAELYRKTAYDAQRALVLVEKLANDVGYHESLDDVARTFARVAAHDRACKERQLTKYSPPMSSSDPVETCGKVAGYKATAAAYFGPAISKKLARTLEDDQGRIKAVNKSGWVDARVFEDFADPAAYVERVRAPYAKLIAEYGVTLDAAVLSKLEANARMFPAALKKSAQTSRWPAGLTQADAGFMAEATARYGESGKVLAVGYDNRWTVVKNHLDIADHKWNTVYVKVAHEGVPYCRIYQGETRMTHEGGGRYSKPFLKSMRPDFQVTRCK